MAAITEAEPGVGPASEPEEDPAVDTAADADRAPVSERRKKQEIGDKDRAMLRFRSARAGALFFRQPGAVARAYSTSIALTVSPSMNSGW